MGDADVDLHERPPLGPLGLANEVNARFGGRPIGLARVALNTGADNVLPRGGPPRSRGMTWSRFRSFRSNCRPQYWQVLRSRSKMLWRVNLTSFLGSRSNKSKRMTRGTRTLNDTVRMLSGCGSCCEKLCHCQKSKVRKSPSSFHTTWAWPSNSRVNARRTVHTLTACQRRFNTSTCWFKYELIEPPIVKRVS